MTTTKKYPLNSTQERWDDMKAGNAAEYGYDQDLVDALAEKMEECAAFWAKKRKKASGIASVPVSPPPPIKPKKSA